MYLREDKNRLKSAMDLKLEVVTPLLPQDTLEALGASAYQGWAGY